MLPEGRTYVLHAMLEWRRKAFFLMLSAVSNSSRCFFRRRCQTAFRTFLALVSLAGCGPVVFGAKAQQKGTSPEDSPVVTKVEPPNWWVGLTPEVMLLISGRGLEATKVDCNLGSLLVERTQASAGGKYLFVWLKFDAETKSGTAVCRITSPGGVTSFELPISARTETIRRFQGLAQGDAIYLIMPDGLRTVIRRTTNLARHRERTTGPRRGRITEGICEGCGNICRI